jgi:hypothetical protein
MMKKSIPIYCLLFTVVLAAQDFKRTATTGFAFLELPVTARQAALGETSIAQADLNAEASFINPASLGFTDLTHSLSVSYAPWFADIKHYATSYAYKSSIGTFSLGMLVLDYGEMIRTERVPGQHSFMANGTFSAQASAIGLSYSRALTDKFSFGTTLKYASETIDSYSANNVVFDAGVLYYTGLSSLRLGATLQNFGTDARYINDQFRMPTMLRLGLAGELLGSDADDWRITALAEALHPGDGNERINVGLEVSWLKTVQLRTGYKFFYDEETYSAGIGLHPQSEYGIPVGIDFSMSDYGRLGTILRWSIQFGI